MGFVHPTIVASGPSSSAAAVVPLSVVRAVTAAFASELAPIDTTIDAIAERAKVTPREVDASLHAARICDWLDGSPPTLTERGARLLRTVAGTPGESVVMLDSLFARPDLAELLAPVLRKEIGGPVELVENLAGIDSVPHESAQSFAASFFGWREELRLRGWGFRRIAERLRRRPVWMLGLSAHTQRGLLKQGIRTLDDLFAADWARMRTRRRFGEDALREVAAFATRVRPSEALALDDPAPCADAGAPERRGRKRPMPVVRLGPSPTGAAALALLLSRKLVTFELTARARRVLCELGAVVFADLVALEPEAVLAQRSSGRITLLELAELAASGGFRLGTSTGELTYDEADVSRSQGATDRAQIELEGPAEAESDSRPMRIPLSCELSTLAPSWRALRVLRDFRCVTLGDLLRIPLRTFELTDNCGPGTLAELQRLARVCGYELGSVIPRRTPRRRAREPRRPFDPIASVDSTAGIERELASAVAACVPHGIARKVLAWLGLGEACPPTLASVGERLGCTREHVRQCAARCRARARELGLQLPVLTGLIRGLERVGIATADEVQASMIKAGLAWERTAVAAVLRAAKLFGVEHRITMRQESSGAIVGAAEKLSQTEGVRRMLWKLLEHCGCTTVAEVARQWADRLRDREPLDPVSMRVVLEGDARIRWLDRDLGWFWIPGLPIDGLRARIDKVLAVAPEIDLAELHAALLRDRRIGATTPPVAVLRSLLEQLGDCAASPDGRRVRDLRPRDPELVLSPNERVVVATLRKHGPVVPLPLAVRLVVRGGINENSANTVLATSILIRRVANDACALVGFAGVPGAARSALRATTTRVVGAMTVGELARFAGMNVAEFVALAMRRDARGRGRAHARAL